ncbi:MAG TPA: RodZ domain-containing protein [Candidatus Acidoferrales bacterium]|jgi:cytoskeletal protein RodZ|nr:RodZ domain-containing protein [Candidatus Acidoferrales bacterium]
MERIPFGEQLKREREMRGVSLEEISTATRIGTRFLEALENEQWDRLPGGIFNRGFIRAVARYLGLDEESLVAEYALETDDPPEVAVWAKAPAPPNRARLAFLFVLLVAALVAGGWAAYQRFGPRVAAWRKARISSPANAPKPPPVTTPAPGPAAGSAPGVPVPTTDADAAAAAQRPDLLELKVEAGKPAEVRIVADGKTLFSGQFAADQVQRFQAQESFEVYSSEASAVLLELNGQVVPPLGAPGQPGRVTLTRKDLKKTQGGQN